MNEQERTELEKVKKQERNITDSVLNRIDVMVKEGNFDIPKGYSVGNALNAAWVQLNTIQDRNHTPVLKSCSVPSIYNSLLYMTVQGLNPIKMQCYFIPFGKELKLFRSYFGTQMVVKRILGEGTEINSRIVYEGDKLELEIDNHAKMHIISHQTSLENITNGKIEGCYVKIIKNDKLVHTEYMSLQDIRVSWTMNQMSKGNVTATQEKFASEFCKRTVINRACKNHINTSDDNDVLVNAFRKTMDNEYVNVTPKTKEFETKGKGSHSLLDRLNENGKSSPKEDEKVKDIIPQEDTESASEEAENIEELIEKNVITPDGEIIEPEVDDGTFIDDDGIAH